ncbi:MULTISPECIES: PIN domain-containing protein [Acinetobacter]|uniref:PIN domain-containing protein n=2 Tax=Moraxellaceae TaxID=468 RepID=UPI001443B1F6|nr:MULTISPECIES: PIN domain-containing protein [Acinetobacter]MDM1486882.1 hypothetical protein [Acinetobacter towneri]
MKKILLVDIENIQKTEKELLKYLAQYQYVYLVYAKSPINLSLDGLQMLSDFVTKKKLVLIKMPKIGPDAADFGLAFLAGQLSIQMDKSNIEFDVMSNDKKIEYIVDLLTVMGFKSQQLKKDISSSPSKEFKLINQEIDLSSDEMKPLLFAIQLLLKNQPKQFNSLNNALKSWLKGYTSNTRKIIEQLKDYQLIQIKDQTVSYELSRMKEALKIRKKGEVQALSKALPSVDEIQIKPHLQRVKQYCDYLSKIRNNKPAKLNSLLNSIQSVLKLNTQQSAQDFTNILIKQNIVKQESTKLTYNDSLIEAWASLDKTCLNTIIIQANLMGQPNTEVLS